MARVLVTAHLGRHFRTFGHYDYKVLLDMGHEVHIAANFNDEIDRFDDPDVTKHQIDFDRNPLSLGNLEALKQLKKLFKSFHFDLVQTQSPSGGAITRIAARKLREKGTKVLYTAHGLHFYKGAPIKNCLVYFTVEKLLGYITDTIITINNEDYYTTLKKLPVKDVKYIHGVGIDLERFKPQTPEIKIKLRKEYGYSDEDFILIYAGELSYRKHQDLIIRAIGDVKNRVPNIKVLFAGTGGYLQQYMLLAKQLGVTGNVEFLGYRRDIDKLMMISDAALSSSRQEGLPVNVMEAMATGLPIIATNCRGNRDLIENEVNGLLVDIDDIKGMSDKIISIYKNKNLCLRYAKENLKLIKKYSINIVQEEMKTIYSNAIEKLNI